MARHQLRVGLLLPSLAANDDATVATPALTTLATTLGAALDLRVFPLRLPVERIRFMVGDAEVRPVSGLGLRLRQLTPRVLGALVAAHRERPFDVLHGVWLHEPGTLALLAGQFLRVPTLLSIGGAEVASVPSIEYGGALDGRARTVNHAALRHATLVSGGSNYVLELARALCPERHPAAFRLAPLPVDAARFSPGPSRSFDPAKPRLLHAASLIPVKDQALLLRAFALVAEQLPGARLDIAGEDPFQMRATLEALRDELGQQARVRFLCAVPHSELPELYRAADVYVLTSWHESQNMAALEAAACGTPVVGTAVGVVPDLAPLAAVAVSSREPADLADALLALLRAPERLRAMQRAAREAVEQRYAAQPASARFLALYAELAASRPR
jgi:glycosyltransferase involved in cell wall biosynthesis